MTHGELVAAIITETAHLACLFNNPSGVARHKDKKTGKTWAVSYGLGTKTARGHDLIGWRLSDGKFVSIDAKVGRDRLTPEQQRWMKWVVAGGGLAGEARSVEEAIRIINGG